jgi:hypothetical protein
MRLSTSRAAPKASSTRKTIGVPPTGTKDLQRAPAASATGLLGPRSPASMMAVKAVFSLFIWLIIDIRFGPENTAYRVGRHAEKRQMSSCCLKEGDIENALLASDSVSLRTRRTLKE